MAVTQHSDKLTVKAGADLSTKQYFFVKLSADDTCVLAAAASDIILGTLQNKPRSGELASVGRIAGGSTLKVKSAATINRGQPITSDAAGKAVVATAGQRAVGRALQDAVNGDVFEFEGEVETI